MDYIRSNFGFDAMDWMATVRELEQQTKARVLTRAERVGDEGPTQRIWQLE